MKITAVRDLKTDHFLRPQFQNSIPDALRGWEMIANDSDSLISRFPADFGLYHLGDFDPQSGKITLLPVPSSLGVATEFKKAAPTLASVSSN